MDLWLSALNLRIISDRKQKDDKRILLLHVVKLSSADYWLATVNVCLSLFFVMHIILWSLNLWHCAFGERERERVCCNYYCVQRTQGDLLMLHLQSIGSSLLREQTWKSRVWHLPELWLDFFSEIFLIKRNFKGIVMSNISQTSLCGVTHYHTLNYILKSCSGGEKSYLYTIQSICVSRFFDTVVLDTWY